MYAVLINSLKHDSLGRRTYRDCEAIVEKLDRSSIGSFAIEKEILVLGLTYFSLTDMTAPAGSVEMKEINDTTVLCYRDMMSAFDGYPGEKINDLIGEVMYWNINFTDGSRYEQGVTDHFDRLTFVSKYSPEYHDYFMVGIWDVDDVERYISAGIDPEMALRLEAV